MQDILSGLQNQPGVQVAVVFSVEGDLIDFVGNPMYDPPLLNEVISHLNKAMASLELIHDEWETIWVDFEDGTIILRGFTSKDKDAPEMMLGVVADSTVNHSFLTVAIRVAIQKLRKRSPTSVSSSTLSVESTNRKSAASQLTGDLELGRSTEASQVSGTVGPSTQAQNVLSVSWSNLSGSTSMLAVADMASRDHLEALTSALARYVGPMAKVFVKETVRMICPDGVYSIEHGNKLQRALAERIESAEDRGEFLIWRK